MSKHVHPTGASGGPVNLETGLEALRSSSEFRGPVEPLEDHDHANDHFALIYESREEQFAAAIPFIRQGLERGERCLYITYENSRDEVVRAMQAYDIDVDAALDSGQLSIHDEEETYLRNETFDADGTIEFLDAAIREAGEEYEALRVTGEMSSVLEEDPECEELIKCEAKANYLFEDVDGLALCQYNRNRFPSDVIRDVISTHPLLIHNERVSHNVHYTPPEEFFGPEKSDREVDRLLGSLEEQTDAKAELHRRERFLRESYRITADPGLNFEEKLHRLLDLARDRMGLDAAALTRLPEWDGEFLVEYAIGFGEDDGVVDASDEVWSDPDEGCFCRQVIGADEPIGKADVRGTEWEDDEIHRELGLTSYLGTKVTSGSAPYGTLWIGSTEPRNREFTDAERTLLELIGQWVSYEIERREHNEAQRELYEVTSDPDRSFEEKLDALFDLGCEQFDLDIGGLAKVDPDTDLLEVEAVSDDHDHLVPGAGADLSETYCQVTVDRGSEDAVADPVAVTDPVGDGFEGKLCYERFGVRAYIGSYLELEGASDRTFWFVSNTSREDGFSEAERTFHNLMGQWVKYELERQQRERELRERTEHLRALVETTPECIKTVAADGTLLQMNSAGLDMVEADSAADVTGGCVYDLIAPEHRQRFREFNERICRGERETLKFDIIGLEGTRRHMESHAAPLRRPDGTTAHVALTRDVTDQRERERELERTERQFEATFNNPSSFMGLLDPDGTVRRINETALEFVGVDEADVRGEKFWETPWFAHSEELRAEVRTNIERAADGEYVRTEFSHRSPDGDTVIIDAMLEPVHDEDGEVVAIVPSGNDITERKEHAQRLEQKTDRLESFASLLAHELRNPTMIGQIYSQQLPTETDSEAVAYVSEAFDRIEDMIDVMLVLTRGREAVGERIPVDLADVAREAWADVVAPDAELDVEIDEVIEADETYIEHLLRNLHENAVEHGGADVTVTVGDLSDGFYVADDGPGIPAEDRDAVFDEGYTTAADSGGSGLGLAFVQKLADVYEWEYAVTESESGGARFEFRNIG